MMQSSGGRRQRSIVCELLVICGVLLQCTHGLQLFEVSFLWSTELFGRMFPVNPYGSDCTLNQITNVSHSGASCWGGAARRASLIRQKRAQNSATLVMDLGGSFFGSKVFNEFRGNGTAELFRLMKYDVLAMDSADFFASSEFFAKFLRLLHTKRPQMLPMVMSNIDTSYDPLDKVNASILASHRVVVLDGRRIGVVAVVNKEFTTVVSSDKHNVTVRDVKQAVWLETAKIQLETSPPNIVLLVIRAPLSEVHQLISEVVGIDMVFAPDIPSAHSFLSWHMDAVGRSIPIFGRVEQYGRSMGYANVTFDENGNVYTATAQRVELRPILYNETDSMDVLNYTMSLNDTVTTNVVNHTLGRALNEWVGNECDKGECIMGNIITDAMKWNAKTDIALWNSGAIRATIQQGLVRNIDVFLTVPFQNRLVSFRMKGSHILEVLQASITKYDHGGFLQMSGVKFMWNTDTNLDINSRIGNIEVASKSDSSKFVFLDANKIYTVVTNDFLISGGDGYSIFTDPTKTFNVQRDYPEADFVISKYIESFGDAGLEGKIHSRIVTSAQQFVNVAVKIGALIQDGEAFAHLRIALDRLNNPSDGYHDDLSPGLYFVHEHDINDCDDLRAGPAALKFGQNDVHAIVGARCSHASTASASIAKVFQMVQVSPSSTSPVLSDKSVFPYFNRVVSSDTLQGKALAALCTHYGWKRVGVVHDDSLYATGMDISFREAFEKAGGEIAVDVTFKHRIAELVAPSTARLKSALERVEATGVRVVVGLFGGLANVFDVFGAVYEYNLLTPPEYQWVGIDGWAQDLAYAPILNVSDPNLKDNILRQQHGSVGLVPLAESNLLQGYLDHWATLNNSDYPDANGDRSDVTSIGPFVYDSVVALAYAFDSVIRDGKTVEDRSDVLKAIRALKLDGVSGYIDLDDKGDRLNLPFAIVNNNFANKSWDTKGAVRNGSAVKMDRVIVFADGTTHAPVDGRGPLTVYSEENCGGERLQLDESASLCGVQFGTSYSRDRSGDVCYTVEQSEANPKCVMTRGRSIQVRGGYTVKLLDDCTRFGPAIKSFKFPSNPLSVNLSRQGFHCRNVELGKTRYIDVFPTIDVRSTIQDATGVLIAAGFLTFVLVITMCYFYRKKRNRAQIEDQDHSSKTDPRVAAERSLAAALLRDFFTQIALITAELVDLCSDWLVTESVLRSDNEFSERFQIVYVCVVMVATIASIRSTMERVRLAYHVYKERKYGIRTAFRDTMLDTKNPVVMLHRTNRDIYGFHLSWILMCVEDVPSIMFMVVILNTKDQLDWLVNASLLMSCAMVGAKVRGAQMYFHLLNRRRALRTLMATKAAKTFRRSMSKRSSMSELQRVSEAYSGGGQMTNIATMLMKSRDGSSPQGLERDPTDDNSRLMGMNLSRYESVYSVSGMHGTRAQMPTRSASTTNIRRLQHSPTTVALTRRPRQRGEQPEGSST